MEKPFKSYNGGKCGNGTYQNIINFIPKHDLFIDAMAGNGGIFFNLQLPQRAVYNDIDPSVIDNFDYVVPSEVIKENLCYSGLIDKYDFVSSKAFIYFDPPYHFDTRSTKQKYYNFDWSDSDHDKFLSKVVTVKSNCMVSHYPCELYDTALKNWHTFDFMSMTRGGLRQERIYMNYAKPEVLQDFRYLGKNYTDRQRIKRKITRFLEKLENLEELERTGILSAVIDKYNCTSAKLVKLP